MRRLIGNELKIAERLEVHSMRGIGRRLHAAAVGRLDLAADDDVRELLRKAAGVVEGHRFGAHFLWTEWSTVVDAWQLASWEDYRDVPRLGVFVRSPAQIGRALSAVQAAGLRSVQLDAETRGVSGSVAVGTMHLAKGLEFRAVAVAACERGAERWWAALGSNQRHPD